MMKGMINLSENLQNKLGLINLPELPDSVDNAVKNLTDPPTKNMGKTLGDLWYLVFGGISAKADKKRLAYAYDLEQYKNELSQSIEQIPDDKKVEPSIQVTAQALENSKYCVSSESLRHLFINLISGSMNSDYEPYVHPSFSEMIKQMSPLDAKLLQYFKNTPNQPIVNYILKTQGGSILLEAYVYCSPQGAYSSSYAASITSLERFGLLTINFSSWLTIGTLYNIFNNIPLYHQLKSTYESTNSDKKVQIEKGICTLTPLGEHFIKVCLP